MIEKLLEGYDLCMGSRLKGTILQGAMPWKNRYLGNPILTFILNVFYRSELSDAHCGLRAFTSECFYQMHLSSPGMEFASEMVIRAAQLNLRRTEVPITLHKDRRGRAPHLKPWRDGKRHVRFMLKYAPLWIFYLPSTVLSLFGIALFFLVSSAPEFGVAKIGTFDFGDHWIILGGGGFSIGLQILAFAGIAAQYRETHQEGYRNSIDHVVGKIFTSQVAFFSSLVLLALGLALIFYIYANWAKSGFGTLYRIREITIATTLLVSSFQMAFSLLLSNITSSNE